MYRGLFSLLVALVGASPYELTSGPPYELTSGPPYELLQHQQLDTVATPNTCRVGDLLCSDDCDLVLLCLANHATAVVANCSQSDHVCDSSSFRCLEPADASCQPSPDDLDFTCHATGLLPNPRDCHTYYTCPTVGDHGTRQTCSDDDPTEYGYDPLYNTCTYTTKDRVCVENPIPACVAPTQSGGQKENPNIYYICVKELETENTLVPWLFRCNKASEVFDDVTKECVVRAPTTTMTTVVTTEGGGEKLPVRFWLLLVMFALPFLRVDLLDAA